MRFLLTFALFFLLFARPAAAQSTTTPRQDSVFYPTPAAALLGCKRAPIKYRAPSGKHFTVYTDRSEDRVFFLVRKPRGFYRAEFSCDALSAAN